MTNKVNPYYPFLKLIETDVDYSNIKDAIEKYLKIAERNGDRTDDVIMRIKNFSMELNNAIMTTCINIQAEIPFQSSFEISTDERVTVAKAAEIIGVSSTTIQNWIKDKNNPLPATKTSKRGTTVSLKELMEYAKKNGKFKK